MLELKNVSLPVGEKQVFNDLSFAVKGGEMLRITGASDRDKTTLLYAMLGFLPVSSGYITIDGEVVNADSASILRSMTAYLPRDLVIDTYDKVSDMVGNLTTLKSNRVTEYSKEKLMSVWKGFGLDADLYNKATKNVETTLLRVIILTVIMTQGKPVVLVDAPMSDKEMNVIAAMARRGAAVIVAESTGTGNENVDLQIHLNIEKSWSSLY